MTQDAINYLVPIAGIALVALVLATAIWGWRRRRIPLPDLQIAVISEQTTYTIGGILALLFLLLSNAAALYVWITGIGPLSETTLAIIWLGATMLSGLGVVAGRRRTYRVYRMPPSD
jgi:hypothetical protein